MNILLLCGWYFPDSVGGTERYVQMLAHDLLTAGCQVTVAAPATDEQEQTYSHEGVTVYRYPVALQPSRADVRGEVPPRFFEHFANWFRRQSFDLVHQHSYNRGCGFYHAQCIKECGTPLIFTAHVPEVTCVRGTLMHWGDLPCDGKFYPNRCTACLLHKKGLPRSISPLMSYLAPGMKKMVITRHDHLIQTLKMADQIVSVAQWLAQVLMLNGIPREKLSVSRHGLGAGTSIATEAKSVNRRLRIAYIGRFDPMKGIHILVEAAKHTPDFDVILYGRANSTSEQAYYQQISQQINGNRHIQMGGEITHENREAIMRTIDVLAVPSLCLETGPLVILEAFAAGIPVIGSAIGGIAETVSDGINGLLLPPGDVAAWVAALHSLSAPHIQHLQKGIPPIKPSHEVAQEMLALYQNILQGQRL